MSSKSSHEIKAEALRLGFSACGIAKAEPVDAETAGAFQNWLHEGGNATMQYMENYEDKRLDPRLLMPGVKSIISVALNYTPARPVAGIANYAIGKDYHDIVKQKLHQLAEFINDSSLFTLNSSLQYRAFTDSAPVLERYWAAKAGLGFIGKNHQLIIPGMGSQFFLGELFVDIELEPDEPCRQHCGNCHRCIDACPTGALKASPRGGREEVSFNASRCLSYLTIENRGDIPDEAAQKMGETFYGCDRCQQACPWNAKAQPTDEPLLQPTDELLSMKQEDWRQLSVEQYRELFRGSAVKRAKYEGLMRNIKAANHDKD
ncbi:MAG: tRNA epoxyqueuosine(34) reductase QueG [Prevotella sp.]|nr:tRNA epoxyqueuosine(34) reductase QueG [Prevotella sp.]